MGRTGPRLKFMSYRNNPTAFATWLTPEFSSPNTKVRKLQASCAPERKKLFATCPSPQLGRTPVWEEQSKHWLSPASKPWGFGSFCATDLRGTNSPCASFHLMFPKSPVVSNPGTKGKLLLENGYGRSHLKFSWDNPSKETKQAF